MKCLICGGESAGEVCNQCIRLEKIIFQKEWSFKAGFIGKAEGVPFRRRPYAGDPVSGNSHVAGMKMIILLINRCTDYFHKTS